MIRSRNRISHGRGIARTLGGGLLVLSVSLLMACASNGPRERQEARLKQFQAAAGEPAEFFRFWDLRRFEVLGRYQVAVWTRINDPWLLTVDGPCPGLEFAQAIAVTSNLQRVTRRFDSVVVDGQKCRISEILPIDGERLRELSQEASSG